MGAMIYTYALLTVTALLSAAWGVLAYLSYRESTGQTSSYYVLSGLAIILIACVVPLPLTVSYKAAVILGTILVVIGAALQRLARLPESVAQAFDLIVILLYAAAFAALHPPKWPTPWLLLLLLLAGLLYWGIQPKLAELSGTVALYSVALLLMIWQALEVLIHQMTLWSWLALSSAIVLLLVKLLQTVAYAYQGNRLPYRQISAPPIWRSVPFLQRLPFLNANEGRHWSWLTLWAGRSQLWSTRLIEGIKLPQLAQQSFVFLPLLLLFSQWLLALSIWGPELLLLIKP